MIRRLINKAKRVTVRFLYRNDRCYKYLLSAVKLLPVATITDSEPFPRILVKYQNFFFCSRVEVIYKKPASEREYIALNYLIPSIKILFDKNYVNYAQCLVLILEDYFLSKKTEKEFEDVLALYSQHAIAAGERFRKKFPLPEIKREGEPTVGFVAHYVAISGFEVVVALGQHMQRFRPRTYTMQVWQGEAFDVFKENGIDLISCNQNVYDVFALRNLLKKYPVDVVIWPTPPFHMFFFFAFGLAPKQIWFSQYLRPRTEFKYVDQLITLGGAGMLRKKHFNTRDWNILPQIVNIAEITTHVPNKKKFKRLFTPARLEKLRQPEFLKCVSKLLMRDPNTHFFWTGQYRDEEVVDFFRKQGLGARNTHVQWLDKASLQKEIKKSDLILACFPLALGTVESIAAHCEAPVVSMFDEEFSLYWRDIYWEAKNGNEELKKICFDDQGNSRILISRTEEEYISNALKVLYDPKLAQTYKDVYKKAHEYAYLSNPNDIGESIKTIIDELYT